MSTYVNKIEPIGVETGETKKKKRAAEIDLCQARAELRLRRRAQSRTL